jgi:hypothetical protein
LNELASDSSFTPAMTYLNASSDYALYNWYAPEQGVVKMSESIPLSAGYEGMVLFSP